MDTKKTVLILEDDIDISHVIQYVLENEGFLVINSTQLSYLGDIDIFQPDLILLDDWLWGKPGSLICAELKANTQTLCIPVILTSTTANVQLTARNCCADDALAMPFDLEEFIDKVYTMVKLNREV